MIVDLDVERPPLPDMRFDVCIAGGGVAGIAVALKLAGAGWRVALFEAGGLDPSEASQELYRGDNAGTENLPLHETRVRALGGSSNHWGGWCRPLDPHDFRRAGYTPDGTWPIGAGDLAPYLDEAAAFLGVTRQAGADLDLDGAAGNLRTIRIQFSTPPAAVGRRYQEDLRQAPSLVAFVNAAVTTADVDPPSGALTSVGIRASDGSSVLNCHARIFVLAMGSVENARRLLLWNRVHDDRLGNRHQLVGRYYLQHLHQEVGQIALFGGDDSLSASRAADNRAFFSTTESFLDRLGIGAARLYSSGVGCRALVDELTGIARMAVCADIRSGAALFVTAEHRPNPDSRIQLTASADRFDEPRIQLDWRLSGEDVRTLREATVEFGRFLIRSSRGRLKIVPQVAAGSDPVTGWTALPSAPGAAGHQMGGARMSGSPADGVVDRDCKVWGAANLYVAGSAVFRTCGHATPTLTVAQLALRLADRLHRVLSS